jgi:hypothetical protein
MSHTNIKPIRLFLATPFKSATNISLHYHYSVLDLINVANGKTANLMGCMPVDTEVNNFVTINKIDFGSLPWDFYTARARLARMFLERPEPSDYLLFLDDDMHVKPNTVLSMLSVMFNYQLDILGAIYPRKEYKPELLAAAAKDPSKHPNLLQHGFSSDQMAIMNTEIYPNTNHPWYEEITGIGTGCMLISRRCIKEMTEKHSEELGFSDDFLGGETVGIFDWIRDPKTRERFSEDLSFCLRWRAMGGKVYAFIGPGIPLTHVGFHEYTADPSTLER